MRSDCLRTLFSGLHWQSFGVAFISAFTNDEYIREIIYADNLLLTANQQSVKLADFGLAREESVTEMMTAETGTYRWMAPEVCSTFFRFSLPFI